MDYEFDFDPEKNKLLKSSRGLCFEDIIQLIDDGKVIKVIEHHQCNRYANQKIIIVNIDNYAYLVPCVIKDQRVFLKTIFPSRKATRQYLSNKTEGD